MGSKSAKIALIQVKIQADKRANFANLSQSIETAKSRGAQLVCLPELFTIPYPAQIKNPQHRALAEFIPGESSAFLKEEAIKHKISIVGGSLYETTETGGFFNTALVYDSTGQLQGKYRKMHIPHDPHYYEQYYFQPGDLGYIQSSLEGLTIAPLICYDQWFPEPARINALMGAQILMYPTAIGWTQEMRDLEPFSAKRWERAMCSHASLNGVYAAGVNRVGIEDEIEFWGSSFVADPFGEVIARASATDEEVLVVDIDLAKIIESQDGWGFLQNRRPESYGELTKLRNRFQTKRE